MARKPKPSPLRWAGEIVVDIVVGQTPKGDPRMLPVRIIVYENTRTAQTKILHQWIAKRPEGLNNPEVKRYIDKQIMRHARRWRSS